MKRLIVLIVSLFPAFAVFAQDAATPVSRFWDDPLANPLLPVYLVIAFMILTVIMIIAVAFYLVKVLNMLIRQAAEDRAAKTGIPYVPAPSWWHSLWERMNASVPVQEEETIEMDHSYDGIRELDNHLPPWWKWLFIATAVWAFVYFIVYHVSSSLPLSIAEYDQELAVADEQARAFKASQPAESIDVNSLVFKADPALIGKGKSIFDGNCNSCHRNDGGGGIGPNLTDAYWLHGGDIKEIFATIQDGVLEKGMPAWGKTMSPQEVRDVTFFVMSLQGSLPANAKGPQGDLFTPADVKPAADSTAVVQASL